MQHTGTANCVLTGVVARLIADFIRIPESPKRVNWQCKDSWETSVARGQIQTTLFHFFPLFIAESRASSMLGTVSPLSGKFPNAYCKIFKFTKPCPELEFIWMSIYVIPRDFWACCPLWVYAWCGLHSVMTTDLLSAWVSFEMIWMNS